jgi:hypothetical protein
MAGRIAGGVLPKQGEVRQVINTKTPIHPLDSQGHAPKAVFRLEARRESPHNGRLNVRSV